MTRINCGIPVEELYYRHLLAEHREIKRIPNCIHKGRYNMDEIPSMFTLGKGHVKFFYNKLLYLKERYSELYTECRRRGFDVTSYHEVFENLPKHLYNNYIPTERDRVIVRKRIKDKLEA